jgi:transposase-like protein
MTAASGLRAARAVCRDLGISDVTLWRWRRRGWIKTVNISGKVYVDLESLVDFNRRAATGEFAKAPSGAAGASRKALVENEHRKCPIVASQKRCD